MERTADRRSWRASACRWVGLAGLAGLVGCGHPAPGPDEVDAVVLIVVDTLRADHLGAWGYPHAVTPNLDALAAQGLRLDDVMSPVPVTLPAVCSLLTGRLPPEHGVRDNAGFVLPESEDTLAERFARAGWRTGAVVGSAVLSHTSGVAQGFETYDDQFGPPYPVYDETLVDLQDEMAHDRRRADAVTDRAIAKIAAFGKKRFFLFVHYFDVHAYYDPPPRYAQLHPERPYDGEITFVDAEIGRLLGALRSRPGALVVVVADHGEGLGEHGEPEHGFLLYQSTLHVPVLFWGKGIEPGRVRRDPISLVDLEPTLAARLRLPPATVPRDGRVLALDEDAPAAPATLYAETFRTLLSYDWSELRALRRGSVKLIHGPRDELYDLASDPHETHDLIAAGPVSSDRASATAPPPGGADALARARDLRHALQPLLDRDPPEAVLRARGSEDPERRRTLESLGYVGGSSSANTAAPRPHPLDALPRWRERQRNRVRFREASLLIRRGDLKAARAKLDTFLTQAPDRADGFHDRALVERQLGDEVAARADLRHALEVDPQYAPSLEEMAATLVDEGKVEEAILYLRRLVRAKPEDPDAHYNLGVAARTLGSREEASRELQEFLSLAPDDARAPRVRQVLQALRE
jgi:choline-sulfatase